MESDEKKCKALSLKLGDMRRIKTWMIQVAKWPLFALRKNVQASYGSDSAGGVALHFHAKALM